MEFTYPSEGEAEGVLRSVAPENVGYVKAWREGKTLVSVAEAPDPLSLLHTLEDYLACISVAEGVTRSARGGEEDEA
jgi:hypothetical protein